MLKPSIIRTAVVSAVLTVTLSTAACGSAEDTTAPVAETQSESPVVQVNQPVTVSGCVRAGESSNTFVLTVDEEAQPGPGGTTTYLLGTTAEGPKLDLQQHIGQRVEVNGVLRSQQEVAIATPETPPANTGNEATGTAGRPTVQTRTEVEVRRLDLTSVRPLGASCAG